MAWYLIFSDTVSIKHCERLRRNRQDTTETNLTPWRVGGGLEPDLTCFRKDKVVLSCQQLGDLFEFLVCAHIVHAGVY